MRFRVPVWLKRWLADEFRREIVAAALRRQEHLRAAGRENARITRRQRALAVLNADIDAADALAGAAARPL